MANYDKGSCLEFCGTAIHKDIRHHKHRQLRLMGFQTLLFHDLLALLWGNCYHAWIAQFANPADQGLSAADSLADAGVIRRALRAEVCGK